MPRDVLLILVLVAVLLNLALLVGVGIARRRWAASPPQPRRPAPQRTGPDRSAVRSPAAARLRPAAWSPTGVRAPAFGAPQQARPITPPITVESVLTAPPELTGVTMEPDSGSLATTVSPATTAILDEVSDLTEQLGPDVAAASPNGPESRSPGTEVATRKGRRFVMPRNDEDNGPRSGPVTT
jgi:hypothetical protein